MEEVAYAPLWISWDWLDDSPSACKELTYPGSFDVAIGYSDCLSIAGRYLSHGILH